VTARQVLPSTLKQFNDKFGDAIKNGRYKDSSEYAKREGERVYEELEEIIRPFILQRDITTHLGDKLPPKREFIVCTPISPLQCKQYNEILKSQAVDSVLRGETKSPLVAISLLKKVCLHPVLMDDNQGYESVNAKIFLHQSPKLRVMIDLLRSFRENGHRALVFSMSTRMMDIFQILFRAMGFKFLRIDGSTGVRQRQTNVDAFNKDNDIDVMLLSTKAGGLGLTLTGADRVIVHDPSWTPADDDQAVHRAYRIGQTREVITYRLIAAGTVEGKA